MFAKEIIVTIKWKLILINELFNYRLIFSAAIYAKTTE